MPSKAYRRLLEGLHRYVPPAIGDHPAPLRRALEQTSELFSPPDGVRFGRVRIRDVPGEWVEPLNPLADAVLFYLHGGGYYMGGIETYRHFVGRLAKAVGLRTVHIDYHLAPEDPFPAAVDDAEAVIRALMEEDNHSQRVIIGGDSAGGGLALSTLLRLRDAGATLPAAAVLFSPWVDLTCSGASFEANRSIDPVIRTDHARLAAQWYAGGTPADTPLVSPLFADLAGLPPVLVQVGTEEVLLDDATRLGQRLQRQAVQVDLDVWEGMVHVWQYYAEWIPEAQRAIDQVGGFVRSQLAAA